MKLPLEYWHGSFNKTLIQGHQICRFQMRFWKEQNNRYSAPNEFREKLKILEMECVNSEAVIIKTIRTPLFIMKDLLSTVNRMKIIHFVRDPRPTIDSQKAVVYTTYSSVIDHAKNFCARVYHDVITFDILSLYYRRQLVRFLYEDLSSQPQTTAQNLYKFINIAYTANTASSLIRMTSKNSSHAKRSELVVEKNSKKVLNEWRLQNTLSYVHEVDSQCSLLYERLEYLPVSTEDMLRNLSIPLFRQVTSNRPIFHFGMEMPQISIK